jgi:hypothetical protein
MANTLTFIDMVEKGSQKYAHEKLSFIPNVDRQYDDSFAKRGAKIGSTLRVTKPRMFTSTIGSTLQISDIEDVDASITLATQRHQAIELSSKEMTLDTTSPSEVNRFYEETLYPMMSSLTAPIESDFIAFATKATYQVAGSAGTAITDSTCPGQARSKLNQQLAPHDKRIAMVTSPVMASMVAGRDSFFNPSAEITQQYKEGRVGRNAMADWYENEKMWTLTNGADVTISTNAAAGVVNGSGALNFDALTASQVTVGAVFTIAGVYDCHPETKAQYPHLKQFTLVSGGTTSGASVVSPAIYFKGPRKNVVGAGGAELTAASFNAQVMTFVGDASKSYVQGLMFHPKAFQFVTADLEPIFDDPRQFKQSTHDGISLSVSTFGDGVSYKKILRIDILYGFAALRPEWSVRLVGSANS